MALTPQELGRRLAARRARARRVLWIERVWPALRWPAALLAAWLAASLIGLVALLPPAWQLVSEMGVIVAVVVLLLRALQRVVAPGAAEVDRRLEWAGGVRHRPLVVIADRPAVTEQAAAALWQAHLDRSAAQVARLQAGWPRPAGASRELRMAGSVVLALLVIGLVLAGADAPRRLARGVWPGLPPGVVEPGPQLQAWVTPPGYTGLPPVFLHPETPDVAVPTGSKLTMSLTGGSGKPTMTFSGQRMGVTALDPESWQAEREIAVTGELVVHRGWSDLGRWTLTALPDAPPMVAWAEAPGAGKGQRRLQTRLPWRANDDYGVTSLVAELHLKDRPATPPLIVTVPLAGAPRSAHGVAVQELAANPWAGLPVVARLVAKDAPGHVAASEAAGFVLPERPFKNPLARALIDIRKRLSLDPEQHGQAASDLSALAGAPEAFDNNTGVFLALSSAASGLERSGAPADIAEMQARLWSLALQLEDNSVQRTAEAVAKARQALQQAVKKGDKTAIEKQAEALRREIQKHLQALAEQARRNGTLMPFDPQERTLGEQDFDKLTREMQEAAKAGHMDEAQQKLQQLQQMLDQLKAAEANPQTDRRQAHQQRRSGQQQMGAAEDMVNREQALKGRAAGRQTTDDPPGRTTDARQQQAMRRALGIMMQNFGDLTGKVPGALSEADIAMDQAGQALGKPDDKAAGSAQQRAIDALKKGEQQMSQQMAQSLGISVQPGEGEGEGDSPGDRTTQQGEGQDGQGGRADRDQGDGDGGSQADADTSQRDPLGRSTRDGANGRAEGGDVHVPDQMEQARTREIQAELRRREGERTRPQDELNYIQRLLKPY